MWAPEEPKYATPGWMNNPWFFVPWMAAEFWGQSLLGAGTERMLSGSHTHTGPKGGRMVRGATGRVPIGVPGSTQTVTKYLSGREAFHADVKATYGSYNAKNAGGYLRDYKGRQSGVLGIREKGILGIQGERELIRRGGARYGMKAATAMSVGRNILAAGRTMGLWFMAEMAVGGITMWADYVANRKMEGKTYGPRNLETGGGFVDTRSAQTQRARALQAIHNSQMTTRAVLGNEASMMHYR